jgi:hypothetical protein
MEVHSGQRVEGIFGKEKEERSSMNNLTFNQIGGEAGKKEIQFF